MTATVTSRHVNRLSGVAADAIATKRRVRRMVAGLVAPARLSDDAMYCRHGLLRVGDVPVELVAFEFQLAHPRFHHVTDADDAGK